MTFFTGKTTGAALLLVAASAANAEIVVEPHEYSVGDVTFEGLVARNSALEEPLGTVVVVHDWTGVDDYERRRAEMLAAQGYTVFVMDLFGQDEDPQGFEDYVRLTSALYEDRDTFRERILSSLDVVAELPGATANVVLIGYCFGGAAVLEAARAGADVAGFVSFHGGLETPEGQDYSGTAAPVLVLHGSADPVSGMDALATLMDELQEAGVPHAAEVYGGALHAFTVWDSSDYDVVADRRSWEALLRFLREL